MVPFRREAAVSLENLVLAPDRDGNLDEGLEFPEPAVPVSSAI